MAPKTNRAFCRASAFTLIELLVVISIIAILAGFLMPTLRVARESAMQTQCMNNQRNLGMAVQMYANRSGERLPSSEAWIDDILPKIDGRQPDNPFDRNRGTMPALLFCPSDPDPFPKPYMTGEMEVTSYFVNGAMTDFVMGGGRVIGLGPFGGSMRLSQLRPASSIMLFGETTNYGKVVDIDHPAAQAAFAKAGASVHDARRRFHHRATSGFYHVGRMSVVYGDGHSSPVQGLQVDSLPPDQWPGGALMSESFTFFPRLSLPAASEQPNFWGPPYNE